MARRREEDRLAFEGLPHESVQLGLLEGEHAPSPRPDSDAEAIRRHVEEWLDKASSSLVAIPAGAGRPVGRLRLKLEELLGVRAGIAPNPDHLFVRDVALDAMRSRAGSGALLYEELPYGLDGAAQGEVERLAQDFSVEPARFTAPVDVEEKSRRVAAYASQISSLHSRLRLDRPESLPPDERYWMLEL